MSDENTIFDEDTFSHLDIILALDNYVLWNVNGLKEALANTVILMNAKGDAQAGCVTTVNEKKCIITADYPFRNITDISKAQKKDGTKFDVSFLGWSGGAAFYYAPEVEEFSGLE